MRPVGAGWDSFRRVRGATPGQRPLARSHFAVIRVVVGDAPVAGAILGAEGTIMTVTDRIEIDPKVMLGKSVIRGTRIPVELLLRKLADGATETDLLDAYPRLTREDIQAVIGYAADALAHEETLILTPRGTP